MRLPLAAKGEFSFREGEIRDKTGKRVKDSRLDS